MEGFFIDILALIVGIWIVGLIFSFGYSMGKETVFEDIKQSKPIRIGNKFYRCKG
jgi:hypothetical protein